MRFTYIGMVPETELGRVHPTLSIKIQIKETRSHGVQFT